MCLFEYATNQVPFLLSQEVDTPTVPCLRDGSGCGVGAVVFEHKFRWALPSTYSGWPKSGNPLLAQLKVGDFPVRNFRRASHSLMDSAEEP